MPPSSLRASAFALLVAVSSLACGGDAVTALDAATDRAEAPADVTPTPDLAPSVDVTSDASVDVASPDVSEVRACPQTSVTVGDSVRRLMWGGVERIYRVHVPRSLDATRPAMVVLNFHGFLSFAEQQADWSNMNEAADARGFIAVHPEGRDTSWNAGVCCGLAQSRGDDDVGFVRALLDALARDLCVDARRVYATGFSNGAFLANRLGCELSDRIAAIAPVSGDVGVARCAPSRHVPVMHFHGDADLVVPYAGSPALGFTSVNDSVRGWATRNGCATSVVSTFDRGDTRCVAFERCPDDGEVVLCTIRGGGHTWPGGDVSALGGLTGRALDATPAMLDFFARHPMP
jgi:polyhydroxybutyrate depolymerase